MVFSNDSALWNEIKLKGFLSYQIIHSKQNKHLLTSPLNTNQNNITQLFNQSPNSNHVRRKLFQNPTTNQTTVILTIISKYESLFKIDSHSFKFLLLKNDLLFSQLI
jgi:hypothetical protein